MTDTPAAAAESGKIPFTRTLGYSLGIFTIGGGAVALLFGPSASLYYALQASAQPTHAAMMLWLVLGLSLAHAAAAFWLVSRAISDSAAKHRSSIALAAVYVAIQLAHSIVAGMLYVQNAS
jgi:nitric oxide reductase large subunit